MIVIDNTLISDDIARVRFACDLDKCLGACCVEGDAGAPLEIEEIGKLEDYIDQIKPFMNPRGIAVVDKNGVFDYDAQGSFVTPLVDNKECAFVFFEKNIARCAIEKAYEEKQIPFPKPLSCHLYPVRITRFKSYDGVNYHRWHICEKARTRGKKENVFLYQFLKESFIRKYNKAWYNKLLKAINNLNQDKKDYI